MRHRKPRLILALAAALAVLAVAGSSGARSAGGGANDCGDGPEGHQVTWTPRAIWPPNHKMETVTITYSDDAEDHTLTLAITGVSHDETLEDGSELNGAGNTPSDWTITDPGGTGSGSVTATAQVRAERSGRGDGRDYTIRYTATSVDSEGNVDNDCSGTVTVSVPHDCRGGACKQFAPEQGNRGKKPR